MTDDLPTPAFDVETGRATWRMVERVGHVAASACGLIMLVTLPAIDPGTTRLWLSIDVILAVAAGYVVATLATTTWMQVHGRPVRRPKRDLVRFGLVVLQTTVLLAVVTVVLVAFGLVVRRLPFATIFVCAPACALLAGEIVDRMVSRHHAG